MRKREFIEQIQGELNELESKFEKLRERIALSEFVNYATGRQYSCEKIRQMDKEYIVIDYEGITIYIDEADYLIDTNIGTYRLDIDERMNSSDGSMMAYVVSITKEV